MLRYRIARRENGRYVVLPALISLVPADETYATRAAARETAEGLNRPQHEELGGRAVYSQSAA